MDLTEYEQKRRFQKTPEPKPAPALKHYKSNRFVIHYHEASHVHYDLRLEMDGVLKSWAVPKGLPTRHDVKKLAVQVEDHPLDYISFEGEIPDGEYGAGTVKIFDEGTFEPAHDSDPEKDLTDGRFSFYLKGNKIRSKFNLIRTRRGNDWLLLMGPDEFLEPWIKQLGQSSKMPSNINPMKAYLTDKAFNSNDWLFEIKWDGMRAVAYLDEGNVSLMSRNQKEQNFRYPELGNLGDFVIGSQIVLDGEIVTLDSQGRPSFEMLQPRMNLQSKKEIDFYAKKQPVVFYVFDILHWNGRDLTNVPLIERKRVLSSVILPHRHIKLSEPIYSEGLTFFQAAKEQHLEGIIAKKKDSVYLQKRDKSWLKIKAVQQQEVVIGGFTDPSGSRPYFGSILVGVYENSKLIYVGNTGTGFDEQTLKILYEQFNAIQTDKNPFFEFDGVPEHTHWIKPLIVAEVKFSEWTKGGKMRQPVFFGIRPEKNAKEVVRELPLN